MPEETVIQAVARNLKDAGCKQKEIERFLDELRRGDKDKQLRLLESHRERLLSKVHTEERRIDCLDYLAYQIRQGKLRL